MSPITKWRPFFSSICLIISLSHFQGFKNFLIEQTTHKKKKGIWMEIDFEIHLSSHISWVQFGVSEIDIFSACTSSTFPDKK